jgi:hypothetical protein
VEALGKVFLNFEEDKNKKEGYLTYFHLVFEFRKFRLVFCETYFFAKTQDISGFDVSKVILLKHCSS